MLVEAACQTDLASTAAASTMESSANAPHGALDAIERPYLKLRTHWATGNPHDPQKEGSRAVRQSRGMAFYGSASSGVQTEVLMKDVVEVDSHCWHVNGESAVAFVSAADMKGAKSQGLSPSGMQHVDSLLN